ncbi:MAG: Gfo/Idh/MocA family protein [Candidatus Puniceispirillaceae bacterium]
MSKINVGLVGTGFMGKAHVFGFATAQRVFDLPIDFYMEMVADANEKLASAAGKALGFSRHTAEWRDIIADPDIGLVNITTPNALHKEIALAAIAAGKHVYCEKPLAPSAKDAFEMTCAAEQANIKTQVGFNYLTNPMFALAKEMIEAGELGEIYSYRGVHAEDYMASPEAPISFRHDKIGGGALADIGSHALATAEFMLGPIAQVNGYCKTLIPKRPDTNGVMHDIEVDDVSHVILEFANGISGTIEANWCATGRTMQHDFEIYGSKGALFFSQERLNELHFFDGKDSHNRRGFRRIEASPAHAPYGQFCIAPGHQIGFNDLKAIEIAKFADAIAGNSKEPFNFRAGYRIQHIVETAQKSSEQKSWLQV